MQPVQPILIVDLFPPLHVELIALLSGLSPGDWLKPTIASGWSVKDMAAHLLYTDIRRLSFRGNRLASHQPVRPPTRPIQNHRELVEHINLLNEERVSAARRIGPQLLLDFLIITGPQVYGVFKSLDPFAKAGASVAWAGEHESLNWFDTAREYTEKWVHQQQIRDAVGRPGFTSHKWLHPPLDTFLCGLAHTFREAYAPSGTVVSVNISGRPGGTWSLARKAQR